MRAIILLVVLVAPAFADDIYSEDDFIDAPPPVKVSPPDPPKKEGDYSEVDAILMRTKREQLIDRIRAIYYKSSPQTEFKSISEEMEFWTPEEMREFIGVVDLVWNDRKKQKMSVPVRNVLDYSYAALIDTARRNLNHLAEQQRLCKKHHEVNPCPTDVEKLTSAQFRSRYEAYKEWYYTTQANRQSSGFHCLRIGSNYITCD